jgi:hypothetical protein
MKIDDFFDGHILNSNGKAVLEALLVARHRAQALYLIKSMDVTEVLMEEFINRVVRKLESLKAEAEGY